MYVHVSDYGCVMHFPLLYTRVCDVVSHNGVKQYSSFVGMAHVY